MKNIYLLIREFENLFKLFHIISLLVIISLERDGNKSSEIFLLFFIFLKFIFWISFKFSKSFLELEKFSSFLNCSFKFISVFKIEFSNSSVSSGL